MMTAKDHTWLFLSYCYLLKDPWRQIDLIGRDLLLTQGQQDLFTILKRKDVIRTLISQIWPCIRIDMAHREADLFLGEP